MGSGVKHKQKEETKGGLKEYHAMVNSIENQVSEKLKAMKVPCNESHFKF